jgi:ABC-2 type transport system ATP-binding protein
MPAIEISRLTRVFGPLRAVDDINVSVTAGSIFGMLGPNGAGKSTTIKMLTTILPPTSGTASVAGFDIVRQPGEVRRRIGYVSQMLSADGMLTGYENLLLFARLYAIPRSQRRQRIMDSLEFMGLIDSAQVLVKNYSGGMIRRLEIAQSMIHRPSVLFLDEPTIGLDPVARHTVWNHLRSLRDGFDTTILMTTHDMEEADELCGTVAIMHRGKIAVVGSPEKLKAEIAPAATLEDVFVRYAVASDDDRASYRDILQTRRTARRLG